MVNYPSMLLYIYIYFNFFGLALLMDSELDNPIHEILFGIHVLKF